MERSLIDSLPHVFFAALLEGIDPKIKEWYEEKQAEARMGSKAGNYYYRESFYDAAVAAVKNQLHGKESRDVLSKYQIARRRLDSRKRQRWLEALEQKCEQTPTDSAQHPFSDVYMKRRLLRSSEWARIYGQKSPEGVIKDELALAKEWAADETSLFIDFPAIRSLTKAKEYSAFEDDVVTSCLKTIKTKWDCDLESFAKPYLETMGGAYFTASAKKIQPPEPGEDFVAEVPLGDGGEANRLLVTIGKEAFGPDNNAITMLDVKDQALLFDIVNRASKDLVASSDKPMLISLGDLAKNLTTAQYPSARVYADAEQRCYKLASVTYSMYNESGRQVGAINYLSSAILVERDGRRYMSVTLGSSVVEGILNSKIKRILSSDFDKIEQKIGKIIILSLQRERVKAFSRFKESGGAEECATTFTFNDLMLMANFGTTNEHKIFAASRAAFSEFEDKSIMIEKYRFDSVSETIRVWFIPLTKDEERDLTWYGYDERPEIVAEN